MAVAPASIVLDGVSLTRGDRRVFAGLSLTLRERRIGLIGDNGAGKSSLLRLFNGLLRAESGAVTICGLDAARHRRDLPARVGFVFQNPEHQIVFPTVLEEMSFGLRERGATPREAQAQARRALAAAGCGAWETRAVHELSDGQKQRLCILAIVALAPSILVLDEPFASLDLPTRLDMLDLIAGLDMQVVMASHDLDLFAGFDRVIWLEKGRVAFDGAPAAAIAAYRDHVAARRGRLEAAQ